MSDFKANCTTFDFRRGSARTPLGELTAIPPSEAVLKGPTSKEREGKGREMGSAEEVGRGGAIRPPNMWAISIHSSGVTIIFGPISQH